MASLPAKSSSRGVQRRHVRRLKTRAGVREVLVNPGVKKSKRAVILPTRKAESLLQQRQNARPALQELLPKVRLRPKRMLIRNKDDLWTELKKDREWFAQNLEGVNNNLDLLKEILFDMFESQLGDGGSESERLEAFKKNFEFWEVQDWFGSGYGMRYTKWGDWKGEKTLDQLIEGEGEYGVFDDPFDGKLFEKDQGQDLVWDDGRWYAIEMAGAGGLAEELMYDPRSLGRDEIALPDSRTMNALRKAGVPFIHLAHGRPYRNPSGDFIFIPKKEAGLAKKVLKELRKE